MESVFESQKRKAVGQYKAALHAGDVDGALIPLLERINSLADYYTTSTCAGRIALFSDAGSKRGASFLCKWHRSVSKDEVASKLTPAEGVTYFRFEPAILHVVARDIEAADRILKAALSSGFRRSGIQSVKPDRVMLEILGTERLDVPVADGPKIIVGESYLEFLVELSDKKYARNTAKINKLLSEVCRL